MDVILRSLENELTRRGPFNVGVFDFPNDSDEIKVLNRILIILEREKAHKEKH